MIYIKYFLNAIYILLQVFAYQYYMISIFYPKTLGVLLLDLAGFRSKKLKNIPA